MRDSMPKRTLWWGIGLSVGGALLILVVPQFMYSVVSLQTQPEAGQTALLVLELALNLIRQLVLPLGTALIAASLVMFYLGGRSKPTDDDRPKRWVLPEPTQGAER
jgi:hypothetical protein